VARAKLGNQVKVTAAADHRDSSGYLICHCSSLQGWTLWLLGNWDTERIKYCEAHRHDRVPLAYREGKPTIRVILRELFKALGGKRALSMS
jgi:hypothetical protein